MKFPKTFSVFLLILSLSFSSYANEIIKLKGKFGFTNDDKIINHKFFDNGTKLLIFGNKNIQTWDVNNAKLISSKPYEIKSYSDGGTWTTILTLGLNKILKWERLAIDDNAKWFVAIENECDKKTAVVRDIETTNQLATLNLPNFPAEEILYDSDNHRIQVIGKKGKDTEIGVWNSDNFQLKGNLAISNYEWHQFIEKGEKVLIGSGDTKIVWTDPTVKKGSRITLQDLKSGNTEKEFTGQNLIKDTHFQDLYVGKDEKYVMATRDKRLFVWEINGNGSPKFEITSANPKPKLEVTKVIDNDLIFVSVDKKESIYEFSGDGKPLYEDIHLVDSTKDDKYFAISKDGKVLFFETANRQKPLSEIKPIDGEYTRVDFLDNEDYFIYENHPKKNKPVRTLFYNFKTGNLDFEVPLGIGDKVIFSPDKSLFYTEIIGKAYIWDIKNQTILSEYKLKPYSFSCDSNEPAWSMCTPTSGNEEKTYFSADGKYLFMKKKGVVYVYDVKTGQETQQVIDTAKVKYDKNNLIKDGGIRDLEFSADGKYLYTYEDTWFYNRKTISIWEISS